jgi:hypothetical protein
MGGAYFIVLERQIDGLDSGMDGKRLSQYIELLDVAASELGVRPLSGFFSMDPGDVTDFLEGEGMDASDLKVPPLQQFTAQDGLASVRALAAHAAASANGVAQDLAECERILSVAAQHGVGWHFEVDF